MVRNIPRSCCCRQEDNAWLLYCGFNWKHFEPAYDAWRIPIRIATIDISKKGIGNSFNYAIDMYVTNTQTNIITHCEKRVRKILRIHIYRFNKAGTLHSKFDQWDENNTIDYVMNSKDHTTNDLDRNAKMNTLLMQLERIGWVRTVPMRLYIKVHWLESLRLFGLI